MTDEFVTRKEFEELKEIVLDQRTRFDMVATAFLSAPVQPKPQEEKKDFFTTDTLKWTTMPATPNNKGEWEKTEQTENAEFKIIQNALLAAGQKTVFSTKPNANYWLLKDLQGKITGIGRRRTRP